MVVKLFNQSQLAVNWPRVRQGAGYREITAVVKKTQLISVKEVGPQLDVQVCKPRWGRNAVACAARYDEPHECAAIRPEAKLGVGRSADGCLVAVSGEIVITRIPARERRRRVVIKNES